MKHVLLFVAACLLVLQGVAQTPPKGKVTVIPTGEVPAGDLTTTVFAEEMPYFQECAALSEKERQACHIRTLSAYVESHIVYPNLGADSLVTGTVFLTYIVDEQGFVRHPRVERGVTPELDEEALRVISELPQLMPARTHGKAVKVKMSLPVRFTEH